MSHRRNGFWKQGYRGKRVCPWSLGERKVKVKYLGVRRGGREGCWCAPGSESAYEHLFLIRGLNSWLCIRIIQNTYKFNSCWPKHGFLCFVLRSPDDFIVCLAETMALCVLGFSAEMGRMWKYK